MSEPTHVQTLFEPALQAYELKTGLTLSEHPLALQLRDCHTVESITTLLQNQARDFSDLRRNDQVIKNVVSILSTLSATSALGESTGLVRHNASMAHSASHKFCRHSHPPDRYKLALLFYLLYVIFEFHLGTLVTSRCTRPLTAWIQATKHLSTCSSRSNTSSVASVYIPRFLIRSPWTRS